MTGFPIVSTGAAAPGLVGVREIGALAPPAGEELPWRWAKPADDVVPRALKRRMSTLAHMVFRSARETLAEAGEVAAPLLLATANGEVDTMGKLLDDLLGPRDKVSPTRFHNSVHNTAAGYWTIATGRREPTTTITMGDVSFEAALLEAWARLGSGEQELLVVAGDEAVTAARWADPPHCAWDLCGCLLLAREAAVEPVGTLVAVRHALPDGPEAEAGFVRALRDELSPTEVVELAPGGCVGGTDDGGWPPQPCAGAFHVLRFLHGGEGDGRLLLLTRGREGDLYGVAVQRGRGR